MHRALRDVAPVEFAMPDVLTAFLLLCRHHQLCDPRSAKEDAAGAFGDAGAGPTAERPAHIGAVRIPIQAPGGLSRFERGDRNLPFGDAIQVCGAVSGETERLGHGPVHGRLLLRDAVRDLDLTAVGGAAFESRIGRSRIRQDEADKDQRDHRAERPAEGTCRIEVAHSAKLVQRNRIGISWKCS